MKNTKIRYLRLLSSVMALAIMPLIGTGLSEARKPAPTARVVRTMTAPTVTGPVFSPRSGGLSQGTFRLRAVAPPINSFSAPPKGSSTLPSMLTPSGSGGTSVADHTSPSSRVSDISSAEVPGFFDNANMTGIRGLKYRRGNSKPHEGTTPDAESYPNVLKAAVSIPDSSSPGINELVAIVDVRQTLELDRVIASMEEHRVPTASGRPQTSEAKPPKAGGMDWPMTTLPAPTPKGNDGLIPEPVRERIFQDPRVADPSVVGFGKAQELKRMIDEVLNIPGDWDKEGDRNIYTSPRGGEPGFTRVDDPDDTPRPPRDPYTGSQKDLLVELFGPGGATPDDGPPVDDQNPGYTPGDGFKLGPPETVDGSGDDDGSSGSTTGDKQSGKADGKAGSKSDSKTKETGLNKEGQEKDKGTSDDPEGGDSPDESRIRAGILAQAISGVQSIGRDSRIDTSFTGQAFQPSGGGKKRRELIGPHDPIGPASTPSAFVASSQAVKADKSGQAGWYDPENPPPPGPEFSPAADSRALTGGVVMNTNVGQAMYTDPDRPPDPDNPPRPNVSPTSTMTRSALGNQTDRTASPYDSQN